MIDFTTVQTYNVPPEISKLNSENISLRKSNSFFKILSLSFLVLAVSSTLYIISKNQNKNGGEE